MRSSKIKRLPALLLALALCLSFAGCSGSNNDDEEETSSDYTYATQGGTVTLAEGVTAPEENNKMVSVYDNGQLSGAFTLINSKSTDYFLQGGSITVTVQATLNTETKWTDAFMSLWKQGSESTEFIGTVHFTADGSPYTYTWSGLDPSAEYRVAFAYNDVPRYKLSGVYTITGLTAQGESDLATNEG